MVAVVAGALVMIALIVAIATVVVKKYKSKR